jgi:hypothetical protein
MAILGVLGLVLSHAVLVGEPESDPPAGAGRRLPLVAEAQHERGQEPLFRCSLLFPQLAHSFPSLPRPQFDFSRNFLL